MEAPPAIASKSPRKFLSGRSRGLDDFRTLTLFASTMLLAAFGVTAMAAPGAPQDDRAAERAALVSQLTTRRQTSAGGGSAPPPSLGGGDKGHGPIYGSVRTDAFSDSGIRNRKVIDAMGAIPRHLFVPAELQRDAYADRPLPIGYGQTISQPYIVALMTELLNPAEGWKILEVGTGSGYQAAVLTKFTSDIYTIEIVEPLHKQALPRLKQFGLGADRVIHGDGYFGIEKAAPFDGIIVTAAADHIPPPLIQQLRPGGRMVLPIGPVHSTQRLVVVEKDAAGKVRTQTHHPVRFVPLTGGPAR